jgi:hypothetical protein
MKNLSLILLMMSIILLSCDNMPDETPMDDQVMVTGPLEVLRSGTLSNQSGAGTRGSVQLVKDQAGKYFISLSDNFTTKFSTGTVTVYLSTSASLRLNESGSFQLLGSANRPGAHFYELQGNIDEKFTHTIIWCGAAAIPFGNALLE